MIEFPALKQEKKIRSMQMFRKPVTMIRQGDRAGLCVAQLDADLIERGIAATPRCLKSSNLAIVLVKRIPYFQGEIRTKGKFHISMGHQTGIGVMTFFSAQCTSQ
jgi:selenocysteine-specific elongation factor